MSVTEEMDKKYLQVICFNCRNFSNVYSTCRLGKFVNLSYPFTCKDYSNKYYMTKEKTAEYTKEVK